MRVGRLDTQSGLGEPTSSPLSDVLSFPEDSNALSCPLLAPTEFPSLSKPDANLDSFALVCLDSKTDSSLALLPVKQEKDGLELLKELIESSKQKQEVLGAAIEYQEKYWELLLKLSTKILGPLMQEAKEWAKTNGAEDQVIERVVELRREIFAEVEEIVRVIPNMFVSPIPYAEFNKAKVLLDEAAWATPKLAASLRAEAKKILHFMPTGFNFKEAIVVSKRWISNLNRMSKVLFVVGFAPSVIDFLEAKTDEEKVKAFKELGEEVGEAATGAVMAVLVDALVVSGPEGWVLLAIYIGTAQEVSSKVGEVVGKAYFGPAAENIAKKLMRIPKPDPTVSQKP